MGIGRAWKSLVWSLDLRLDAAMGMPAAVEAKKMKG